MARPESSSHISWPLIPITMPRISAWPAGAAEAVPGSVTGVGPDRARGKGTVLKTGPAPEKRSQDGSGYGAGSGQGTKDGSGKGSGSGSGKGNR